MTAVPSTHILNDGMPMRSEKCLVRFGSEAEISRASQNVRSGAHELTMLWWFKLPLLRIHAWRPKGLLKLQLQRSMEQDFGI